MFSLEDIQARWVLMAIAGGVVLVLAVILACMAFWRPRREEGTQGEADGNGESRSTPAGFSARVPWFLILIIAGLAAYAAIYVWFRAQNPPNW